MGSGVGVGGSAVWVGSAGVGVFAGPIRLWQPVSINAPARPTTNNNNEVLLWKGMYLRFIALIIHLKKTFC